MRAWGLHTCITYSQCCAGSAMPSAHARIHTNISHMARVLYELYILGRNSNYTRDARSCEFASMRINTHGKQLLPPRVCVCVSIHSRTVGHTQPAHNCYSLCSPANIACKCMLFIWTELRNRLNVRIKQLLSQLIHGGATLGACLRNIVCQRAP